MDTARIKLYAEEIERLAFSIPAPNPYTPQLVLLALAMKREALLADEVTRRAKPEGAAQGPTGDERPPNSFLNPPPQEG